MIIPSDIPSLPNLASSSSRTPYPRRKPRKIPEIRLSDLYILVVDDDPAVLQLTETMLVACGYSVCAASNAKQALLVLSRHPAISLMLTDLHMQPDFNGLELAEKVTAERPELPVVLMSGSILTAEQERTICERCWKFVDKPILMPHLLSVVSMLLRRPAVRRSVAPMALPKAG